ncbi:MAG: AAA family ATPase [Bacteroidetes bacterium]|nr:AAA family ATPase [Bacteroidota bacterium]
MQKSEAPLIPVSAEDLRRYREEVSQYLKLATWKPDRRQAEKQDMDVSFLIHNKALGIEQEDSTSIMKEAVRISDDRMLLSNTVSYVLNSLRDGLCLGKHLARLYEQSSGLEALLLRNRQGSMHQSELPEFHDKLETAAAISVFAAAAYTHWRLAEHRAEEASAIKIQFGGIPEVVLQRPSSATSSMLYYYGAYLERSGTVNSELDFLALSLLYFERMIEEVQLRKDAFRYTEFFTNNHYRIEHSEFVVQGWETVSGARVHTVEFNRIEWGEIVANRDAKHMFRRFAERLLCYDPETRRNPMLELGGLPAITMGDGRPGTGKSMLIAATATFLQDMCERIGRNFLFWPLPENIISTYQGGSAERAAEWFRPMQDTTKIVFAPIDDAENNLEERTRQGVSAGVREFIGVFLRNTEGAYAVNHGNKLISLFTNIPDQLDKAVLSRIQYRVAIDGAKTQEDFLDQDFLWWKKFDKLMPGFVGMKDPQGYQYLQAQEPIRSLSAIDQGPYQFSQDGIRDVYEQTHRHTDPTEHRFFSLFYTAIMERYPFFSSRDLRNIQKSVDARVIDVDFPETWMESPDEFFRKDYDTKLNMLRELVRSNLGTLSFADLRLREALNYMENALRINASGLERDIEQARERLHVQHAAMERLESEQRASQSFDQNNSR